MHRLVTAVCILGAALAGVRAAPAAPGEPGDPVIDWNRALLAIVRTPGAQPATVHPTRDFALLHAAIADAVASVDGSGPAFRILVRTPRGASATAAADAAAHAVLVALHPAQAASLDDLYATELARVPDGDAKDAGIGVGTRVAHDILAIRADDGSTATPPPLPADDTPGAWRPTPPGFAPAVFTHWGQVVPFLLDAPDTFRPPPPPTLDSNAWADAIIEVQELGSATSATRTDEQTTIGRFWAAPIQNYWNEIAQNVALAHHLDLPDAARLFATLDLAIADAAIAFYDAKYAYRLWRPITAIRLADDDGNPRTTGDPGWTPLATTPPDPSYPGAHSVVSATAAEVLRAVFGDREPITVTSEVLPGVTRSFTRFSDAVAEAGLSRIYAGIHTRLDDEAGQALGRDVAQVAVRDTLRARRLRRPPRASQTMEVVPPPVPGDLP